MTYDSKPLQHFHKMWYPTIGLFHAWPGGTSKVSKDVASNISSVCMQHVMEMLRGLGSYDMYVSCIQFKDGE